jgi:hypothetical protein
MASLSVQEAAQRSGVSGRTVRRWLSAAAAMWRERCRILEAQVEQLRALPAPPPDVPQDASGRDSDARPPEPVQAGHATPPALVGVLARLRAVSALRSRRALHRRGLPSWVGEPPWVAHR